MRRTIVSVLILYFVNTSAANTLSDQIGFKIGMSNASFAVSEENAHTFLGHEIQWLIRRNQPGLQFGFFKSFDIALAISSLPP